MVQLITTTRILSALEAIPPQDRGDLNLPPNPSLNSPITHDQLIRLSRYFQHPLNNNNVPNDRKLTLNTLLKGTTLYIPPPPPKPTPSPEYLALKARLQAAYEKDTYNSMTSTTPANHPSSIFASSTPTLSAIHDSNVDPDTDADADTLTPSLVLNIFLSVIITGFSVYWALTSFPTPELLRRGGGGVSEAVRVLLALAVAVGVGIAEVVIYAIYLGKVERARKKERGVRERKVVVGREVLGAIGGEESERVGGVEEIWGKGPNGGLRRRVRERWEEMEKENGGG
ncbi:endoplasmic reticulum-based factor for assembly of V-ATPase-domain-containing protein [Aspergillus leporis]|uniref:Endoplasmic reticulum-based factor for assembly of V-ATPase-domain-containing protein n=1 Tax=Aspergillus leporis TaxID=41062 RepID=A0A5N5X3L9_9EURO|nr:endoplasmic reticulum-based factor for assembly of V-ATPase-domain-containing protein [Aspergillus leporis]